VISRLAAFGFSIAACAPSFGASDSSIDSPRILAIRAEPAEAKPGTSVTFRALVAGPDGTVPSPVIRWAFCSEPKPLTTNNVVSDACLSTQMPAPEGAGGPFVAATPADGCTLFGPDPPASEARPRDPDATGGYYQPLRADLAGAASAFALARILCDRPNATAVAAANFAQAYVPNANPTLLPVAARLAGAPASLSALPSGARVELDAAWPATSAETYAYFDAVSGAVTFKREAMSVAWYATDGSFDTESTGRAEDDVATTTSNAWVAPSRPQTVHFWVVLRDSRGGVDFASFDGAVVP
jgi:hypothetical protein